MSDDQTGSTRFELRNRRGSRTDPAAPYDDAPEGESDPVAAEPPEVTEPAATDPPTRSGVGRPAWAVLTVAAVAVVVAALAWRSADGDPDRARAELRDTALIEGTAAVETMNTMDAGDVEGGLDAWRSVSTGVLHDQLVAIGPEDKQVVVDGADVAVGRVVQAALVDLTERTATMIAAVEVTVTGADGEEPAVKRNRYAADLVLVDGHWKLENIQQVAVSK